MKIVGKFSGASLNLEKTNQLKENCGAPPRIEDFIWEVLLASLGRGNLWPEPIILGKSKVVSLLCVLGLFVVVVDLQSGDIGTKESMLLQRKVFQSSLLELDSQFLLTVSGAGKHSVLRVSVVSS